MNEFYIQGTESFPVQFRVLANTLEDALNSIAKGNFADIRDLDDGQPIYLAFKEGAEIVNDSDELVSYNVVDIADYQDEVYSTVDEFAVGFIPEFT